MGRTFKDSPFRPHNKEAKEARKRTNRAARKHNRNMIQSANYDCYDLDDYLDDETSFDPSPRTEGHETH